MNNVWIIAQADADQPPSRVGSEPVTDQGAEATTKVPDGNTPEPDNGIGSGRFPIQFVFLALMVVIFYMFILRGPRKQQQKHKQMVQSLAKNDRVRTIGGILGTVVDVRDDEVTLKIDESNNTKIKISTSAIGKNLTHEGKT